VLIRLLPVALRVLTLLEVVARRCLGTEDAQLAGLYVGNSKQATAQPTAKRLLEAFREVTLTVLPDRRPQHSHLTRLSALQRGILALLDFPLEVYTRFGAEFPTDLANKRIMH
jgi:hypothetical protein